MTSIASLALAASLLTLAPSLALAEAPPAYITAAVASPDRPKADSDRDADRHPAELVAFAGVKPGDRVGDLIPGGGYFTRIFAGAVGANGKVFAIVPSESVQRRPEAKTVIEKLAAEPANRNVTLVVTSATDIQTPEPLDVIWTSQNYHDIYNGYGEQAAAAVDAAVFKALKPGGVFMVVDHVALPNVDAKPMHRIDPALVKAQVTAAGFVLEGESQVLRNPADAHDKPVFDPSIRGKTDQFVLKFRKPG